MQLDKQTRRNLEIYNGGIDGVEQHSLLATLDQTQTSMGARLMRKWIGQPLITIDGIQDRQNYVEMMFNNPFARNTIRTHLKKISDLERLAIRVKNETANPRDLLALKQSLQEIPNIKFIYRNDSGFENIDAELIETIISNPEIRRVAEEFWKDIGRLLTDAQEGKSEEIVAYINGCKEKISENVDLDKSYKKLTRMVNIIEK